MTMRSREKFGTPEQRITNAAELYFQAIETVQDYEKAMNGFLDHLRKENPGKFEDVTFICAKVKDPTRYKEKVDGDYNGKAERAVDLVRGTFVCGKDDEIFELQDALSKAFDVVRTKDNFFEPTRTGFRNFNNNIRMPNGHIVESQVMFAGTWAVKTITHDIMEKAQEIDRNPDKSVDDVIQMNSLVKAARAINNSAVARMKTENLINPEWTAVQKARFTMTEFDDKLGIAFRASARLDAANDDKAPGKDNDANPDGQNGELVKE